MRLLGLDIFLSLDLGLDSSFQTIFKKSDLVEMLRLVTHTTTSTTTISPILHPFMKHHKHDISPQAKKVPNCQPSLRRQKYFSTKLLGIKVLRVFFSICFLCLLVALHAAVFSLACDFAV